MINDFNYHCVMSLMCKLYFIHHCVNTHLLHYLFCSITLLAKSLCSLCSSFSVVSYLTLDKGLSYLILSYLISDGLAMMLANFTPRWRHKTVVYFFLFRQCQARMESLYSGHLYFNYSVVER